MSFIITYGEANRSGDDCHSKDSLLLIVLKRSKRKRHAMTHMVTWQKSQVQSGDQVKGSWSGAFSVVSVGWTG